MTSHKEREQQHERIQAQSIIETYMTMISACYKLSRSPSVSAELRKVHAEDAENYARGLLDLMQKNNAQIPLE